MNESIGDLFATLFFPIFIPAPVESASLPERVQRLEGIVLILLELVQTLAVNTEPSLGPGAMSDQLRPLAQAASEPEAISLVDAIDHEFESGNKSAAVRKFRDEFGCTWDHALQYAGQWHSMQRKDRIRFVRLSRMMRCLEAESRQSVEKSAKP